MVDLQEFPNSFLLEFEPDALGWIGPRLEHVALHRGDSLVEPDTSIAHIYFPIDGLASVVSRLGDREIDVGMIGKEGMSGSALAYDKDVSPLRTCVRIPGSAWRIEWNALREAALRWRSVQAAIVRHAYAFGMQVAETAAANALFPLDRRLARWLMMCRDCTQSEQIAITHDVLAQVLGVRRPAVTLAIQLIEGQGLIRATRGSVLIWDPAGLAALVKADVASGRSARRISNGSPSCDEKSVGIFQ